MITSHSSIRQDSHDSEDSVSSEERGLISALLAEKQTRVLIPQLQAVRKAEGLPGLSSLIWCLYGPVAQGSMRCSPHTAVTFSRLRELLSCGCALCASAALRGAALVTFIQTACCLCGFSLSASQPHQFSCNPSAFFTFFSFFWHNLFCYQLSQLYPIFHFLAMA